MIRPAYIVEGDLEQDFVQIVCPGAPVRKIGCNGDDVDITAIAERVATHARLLQKRFNPIVVIFDREGREAGCGEIEKAFFLALQNQDVTANIIVGIPDRDIEVWILADFEAFAQSAGIYPALAETSHEGIKGKGKLKKLLPEGKAYVETIHGVAWLKRARPSRIKQNSPSFSKFHDSLQALDCWWFQQIL